MVMNKTEYKKLQITEVIKMLEKSRETGLTADYLILSTPQIYLPSDEEIEEQSWGYREVTKDMPIPPNEDWFNGAKWMKEQILNQNK